MSEQYAREILRRNIAHICQTIRWDGIRSTPLDILTQLLEKYLRALGTRAVRYAEQFNRTEPNLDDLALVFRDLNVQIPKLAEYTRCVPSVPLPVHVERFPKPKESDLNFLKPGSHEVVTRPIHVHEHLPPMYSEKERDTTDVTAAIEFRQNAVLNVDNTNPAPESPKISDIHSPDKPELFNKLTEPVSKKPRLEEEKRTRIISSVMMTTSGFLSPALEGKLPEVIPPTIVLKKRYDKNISNPHHTDPTKVPILEKGVKKSKKSKLLNGKIIKSKRKDKSHKANSNKLRDSKKSSKHTTDFPDGRESNLLPNNKTLLEKGLSVPIKPSMAPPVTVSSTSSKSDTDIKKRTESKPNRSKINIFKRTNKSKKDKNAPEVVPDKSQSDTLISRLQNFIPDNTNKIKANSNVKLKTKESVVNTNNNGALDLAKEIDLTPIPEVKPVLVDPKTSTAISKTAHSPKDVGIVSSKLKREKKNKTKKDKSAKLEAKLLKKQQRCSRKSTKSSKPIVEPKVSQVPAGSPSDRNLLPGPGLIPDRSLIPGCDFFAGLSNNPLLRGLPHSNFLNNPYALGTGGSGLMPCPGFLPGNLEASMANPLMTMNNSPHSSQSLTVKTPSSLEAIPVGDNEQSSRKSSIMSHEVDRREKHKSLSIPNILRKRHKKTHTHHNSLFKIAPVASELNPPEGNPKQEPHEKTPQLPPARSPLTELAQDLPKPEPLKDPIQLPKEVLPVKEAELAKKKKKKSHKKEKKSSKIKKKKDKKSKNKDKSEKGEK